VGVWHHLGVTRLAGAHVLVTGGSSGIGLAVAEQCAAAGSRVSIVARNPGRLAAACDRVTRVATAGPGSVVAESADVTDPAAVQRAVVAAETALGPVDVCVTSAGYALPGGFTELDDAAFRDQMEVDYFGTVHVLRAVVPGMVERRRGHLVLVSSTVATLGVVGYSAYAPVKFAVRGLAETLRPELAPYGIVVACSYPPDTDTPGYAEENRHKPDATRAVSANIEPRTAGAVGRTIVRGIERDRLVITSDPTTTVLVRAGALLRPFVDRHLDRLARKAGHGPGA